MRGPVNASPASGGQTLGLLVGGQAHLLLERGELVTVFPEGTPGIGKHFRDRYKLQTWRVGHVELALAHRAPVIPVAIVGAEEQMPQVARIPVRARVFGAPYLPVMLTLFPLRRVTAPLLTPAGRPVTFQLPGVMGLEKVPLESVTMMVSPSSRPSAMPLSPSEMVGIGAVR